MGYYRFRQRGKAKRTDMDLRSQMQRIALRWPAYGYRRVHAELLRQGWTINHKRVLRLLRVDNLLCVRRRKFLLGTTDSRHGLPIYPNLAADLVLTSIDQLWVADITYIRLQWEFVYLAVVLDAFSRRCLGWALQRSLESALVLEALRMALMRRHPRPGLVHHSDRGVQYASRDYTTQLEQHGIRISMSRLATPYDNARAESFMKTLRAGIVVGRCQSAHADTNAVLFQLCGVVSRGILHPTVGMMDESRPWVATHQGHTQRFQNKSGFQTALQGPAQAASGKCVQHNRQVHKLPLQADVGDIGDPELINAGQYQVRPGWDRSAIRVWSRWSRAGTCGAARTVDYPLAAVAKRACD